MTRFGLRATVGVLWRGVFLGLALLGALVCLIALRLSTPSGLLLLVAAVSGGLLCLAGRAAGHRAQVRRHARTGTRQLEAWLRHSRKPSKDAE